MNYCYYLQFRVADLMFRMAEVLERIHATITPERIQKIINGNKITL